MVRFLRIAGLAAATWGGGLMADVATGDASRGEQLLRDRGCISCHRLNGAGGKKATDLGRLASRNYTPASLAGVMWNHAPAAWAETTATSKGTVAITPDQAADLFAFFSSRRYFEPSGDAKRGKHVFVAKKCASCHGIRDQVPGAGDAKTVVEWRSSRNAIGFAEDMWNLQEKMDKAFVKKGVHHPRLTSAEINDLLVYLENVPEIRRIEPQFQLAGVEAGRTEYHALECDTCHAGKLNIEKRSARLSMADIQAAIWNHASTKMIKRPTVNNAEMRDLVAYLSSLGPRDDPRRGERLFAKNQCAACHTGGAKGAAPLTGRDLSPESVVAALSNHAPAMRAGLNKRGIAWPRFDQSEISDIAAYLRTPHQAQ
jgi:mono/diheme cytochrome c family protein